MQDKVQMQEDEITIKTLVLKAKEGVGFLRKKWLTIVLFAILGAVIGFWYATYKKAKYVAVSTFVLEEGGKGGGLSQYAGLASLAGIDISGGAGSGIFQGDNIIELYKSRLMLQKALLSSVTINSKSQLLIDRYIKVNKLDKDWEKAKSSRITFNGDPLKFNRQQDSIITHIIDVINNKILQVSKPDKKLSIIKVEVESTDELFSKEFNNMLVETVNNFYLLTKTKKSIQNVRILQKQADSVKAVLGASIGGVASAIDATPNANPALVSLRVPSQKRQIDVQTSSAIYSEIVKNLEVSKISLRQETPLIQVIDQPVLPLKVSKIGKIKGAAIGFILAAILTMLIISLKKIFSVILN
jgi:uncharacterized protein involved in exopolysaccharide biosynthesis